MSLQIQNLRCLIVCMEILYDLHEIHVNFGIIIPVLVVLGFRLMGEPGFWKTEKNYWIFL
jgi:hypothetical protein